MLYFDGVIVVEGTNDASRIGSVVKSEFVVTNGFDLPADELDYLRVLSSTKPVLIMTDSDAAGQTIRDRLHQKLVSAEDVFVDSSKCNHHGKHGVAECDLNEIINVLQEKCSHEPLKIINITTADLCSLGLSGPGSMERRRNICSALHLGNCNGKKMCARLSALGISLQDLEETIKEYQNED